MSGLQHIDADRLNVALPADDLLSQKSQTFTHPQEVLDDRELTLSDKRALLASWASDALAVEHSPSLRQLASGAVVCVDDVIAALKFLDLNETRCEVAWTFSQSFARRPRTTAVRRRDLRPDDDDEPPPSAAGARIPTARTVLTVRQGNPSRGLAGYGPSARPAWPRHCRT
jgi:hypothetical protein